MKKYATQNACDATINAVQSTLKNLERLQKQKKAPHYFLGWDGYIDTLYRMVKNRKSPKEAEFYDSMADFGQRIMEIAGSSGSIERVLKKKLGGGFSVNTARAIANMSPRSTLDVYGTLGFPKIDPIFPGSLPNNIALHSVGNMGLTLAMEFNDGKIMSQDMEGIITLDYDTLIERMGAGTGKQGGQANLIAAFERADAIGNGHWSLMPYMNNYWEHFISDILPSVKGLKNKIFFVDPADLAKRNAEDIRAMLFLLKKMSDQISVLLTVNDREAIEVSRVLMKEGVDLVEKGNPETYEHTGKQVNQVLNLSYYVIHDPHFATITGHDSKNGNNDFHHWITEGYTSTPKFTTGAGDHFNGGVVMALLAGMSPTDALIVANSATAIFVRTGRSPTIAALHQFIENYLNYIEEDVNQFCFPD